MRIAIVCFIALFVVVSSRSASAAIITINYSGTYIGSWSGNYDPRAPFSGGQSGGSMGSGDFSLTFRFDTSLAETGHFTPSSLDNFANGLQRSPSVGSGSLSLSANLGLLAGGYFATDTVGNGETTQRAYDLYFGKGGMGISPTISMTVTNPIIQPNILTPFAIESPVAIGSGYASYWYELNGLGGGIVTYYLTPFFVEVSSDLPATAVPEMSSWAMLLIGFVGIGFATYRKRRQLPTAVM
jgi:hypothetical protein